MGDRPTPTLLIVPEPILGHPKVSSLIPLDSIPFDLRSLSSLRRGVVPSDLAPLVKGQPDLEARVLFEGTQKALEKIYAEGHPRWVVTFSGGKDSTLVAILAIDFLLRKPNPPRVDVVYADTRLEIPAMKSTADAMLDYFEQLAGSSNLDLRVNRVESAVDQSFWVCMIGRGYPPPKPKFRWCTRRLKITPAQGLVENGEKTAVLTGVRYGESASRTGRLVASCANGGECGQDFWYERSDRDPLVTYFAPVINWRTCKVWDFLTFVAPGAGWPTDQVVSLYGDTSMRFGCWTCTLVRRDRTVETLVEREPDGPLAELNKFRNLILEESALSKNRYYRRGRKGPLSLAFRKDLLIRLLTLQESTGLPLISKEEVQAIRNRWKTVRPGRPAKRRPSGHGTI